MPSLLAVAPVDHPGGAATGLLGLLPPRRRADAYGRHAAEPIRP